MSVRTEFSIGYILIITALQRYQVTLYECLFELTLLTGLRDFYRASRYNRYCED